MDINKNLQKILLQTQSHTESIEGMLNDLVSLTEEKYSYVYENLPRSEQEIKYSIREVEILLNYLIYNTEGTENNGTYSNSVIVEALNRIQQEFEEVTESFLNKDLISVLLKTFLDDTGTDRKNFSELGRLAQEVNDTLAGLRDLALNSIIFSIRVGDEGAGFQIIADRINEISSELGTQFSRMNSAVEELNAWNQDFQKQLVDFIQYEDNLKSKYQQKFHEEFSKVGQVLRVVCEVLNNHLNNTNAVFTKVPEAMVLIQSQDIVRQNIENLVKTLRIVSNKSQCLLEPSRDEVMNYLVFAKKVAELSDSLTDNIEEGLEQSIATLERVLGAIAEQAEDLEDEGRYLAAFFSGAGLVKLPFNVMDDVFSTIMGQVIDLLYIKRHIENKSGLLLQGRETFARLMENVELDFGSINRQVKTLKKMKVLLKIELARISNNDNSMENIVSAVDQVIETVTDNQALFSGLREFFTKNMDEFNKAVDRTRTKLEYSASTLELSRQRLSEAHKLVSGAIHAMLKEMNEIFTALKTPYHNLQVTEQISSLLNSVREELHTCTDVLATGLTEVSEYYQVTHWEEKGEDFKLLLEQFTCYVERKSASTVFNHGEEQLKEHSSDIVLF